MLDYQQIEVFLDDQPLVVLCSMADAIRYAENLNLNGAIGIVDYRDADSGRLVGCRKLDGSF